MAGLVEIGGLYCLQVDPSFGDNRWVRVTLYDKNAWCDRKSTCWVDEKFHILILSLCSIPRSSLPFADTVD